MESLKKLLLLSVVAVATADVLWNCPDQCQCAWSMGNKLANCSYAGFSDIPTMSPEMQILNLTGNNLAEISRHAFENAGLINMKKLILRDCKLNKIHEHGLNGLRILLQLDLSKNYLTTLRNNTFNEIVEIRWMSLNDNQLEKLEDGLFSNLPDLRILDLSNNKIFQIGVSCFTSATLLQNLRLDNNRLEYVEVDTFNKLNSLSSLELNDNPWRCDCKLQPFRDWMLNKKILTHADITCAEPNNLRGELWNDFVCQPDVEVVPTTESAESEHIPTRRLPVIPGNTTITLTVLVNGKPLQEIYWGPNVDWEVKYYTCGEYLCTSHASKERIVKLSNSQRPSAV